MFCRNCGKQVAEQAAVCVGCGFPPGSGANFCWNCGAQSHPAAAVCVQCGVALGQRPAVGGNSNLKSKMAAGLLGIFLGGFGVHRFYLGYTGIAVAQLILGIVTCGVVSGIWGLVEGIMILTGSINKDAQGMPLRD
jgi:TM2 domain-containing membrane protein YozV